ncbi:MAG: leucyl aminopeptidase family protein [Bacteroidia bacterium]
MNTSITRASTADKRASVVYLVENINKWKGNGNLSKDELNFVKKQFDNDNKIVSINKLDKWIFVYQKEAKDKNYQVKEAARKAANSITASLNKYKVENIALADEGAGSDVTLAFAEGVALSNYQFSKYFTGKKKKENSLKKISIVGGDASKEEINQLQIVVDATYLARDLVNEPLSYLTATQLTEEFRDMCKVAGVKITVWDKKKIVSEKMGGLLAVNKGSIDPPTFTIMEYKPSGAKNKKPIVLVGKGVVFDTGGLSLKPTANSMDMMKCDMAGAAAVGSAIYAVAKARLPIHIVALVPATDNRPDGNAYVPGDVITMYNGATVEVLNTDAEGRMILADALTYAKNYKPELVLDFATLTGAAAAAVGQYGIVCMGTAGKDVMDEMKEAGNEVYERLAEFPFWEEYDELIKSDIADMKNVGGPYGGAITAGKFLQRFTDYPWIHFDIAGPAFIKSNDSYRGKNGTGTAVRFIFEYLKRRSGSKSK